MNTLNKRIILQLFVLIIVLVSGGYVIFEKYKTGWDWEKYEKYSQFYDKINKTKQHPDSVEDFMVGMPQDTEFDKTWYLTFLYMKRGIEARDNGKVQWGEIAQEVYERNIGNIESYYKYKREFERPYTYQSENYYKQAYEYRQKIEEMKANLSR